MNLLEVVEEISRRNVESTNKFFLAVNDKVLQEKGTKEGTIQFTNSEGKIIEIEMVPSQKFFHQAVI